MMDTLNNKPEISNVVIKYHLTRFPFKLAELSEYFPGIDYRPKRFSGAILKFETACLLIFNYGKINVVGAKSIESADSTIAAFCMKLNLPIEFHHRQIVNMVGTSNFKRKINLDKLSREKPRMFEYYPELFPAAYYRNEKKKCLLFHTGKMIITGCKTYKDIESLNNEVSLCLLLYGYL
uniref:TATA-box-binding protein n=1 Tax=Tetranychus urticae TaxID=32264 RepID=T1KX62_TETUR